MINFYKNPDPAVVAKLLTDKIASHLKNGKVLWLVAGGSSMLIATKVSQQLRGSSNLSNLTISLTDERFGPVGHIDSNWKQLKDSGFSVSGANLLPVLEGLSLEKTVSSYTKLLNNELAKASYSLALAGMGADGHIFGIKPHSPAVDSQQDVVGYAWDDYNRLTPTIKLIKKLSEVIIYAVGAEKHAQLDRIEEELSAQDQPAQLLKQAKQVLIYNDYKGDVL